jgi:hypothetical protein
VPLELAARPLAASRPPTAGILPSAKKANGPHSCPPAALWSAGISGAL